MSDSSVQYYGAGGAVPWQIVNVVDSQGQGPSGGFTKGKDITFQLAGGQTGTFFVPLASFNPDAVKGLAASEAAKLQAVLGLTHNS